MRRVIWTALLVALASASNVQLKTGSTAPLISRRAALSATFSAASLPIAAAYADGVPEGMKTSESYTNLQQISPETTGTLGAGTMSSRSRPSTGVVLLEDVQEAGKKDAPTVTADLVLDGGVLATAVFDAASGYPLVRGMFYDVEVKGKAGDSAFLQVAALPGGKSMADMKDSFFTKSVFATEGRFGAYGAATDIKVLSSDKGSSLRIFDVAFSALSPGALEVPRRALVAAIQPEGSTDVVMLVGSSTSGQWKKCEPAMKKMASSLRVVRTRATSIPRKAKNDYRFEDQGGLLEKTGDVTGLLN